MIAPDHGPRDEGGGIDDALAQRRASKWSGVRPVAGPTMANGRAASQRTATGMTNAAVADTTISSIIAVSPAVNRAWGPPTLTRSSRRRAGENRPSRGGAQNLDQSIEGHFASPAYGLPHTPSPLARRGISQAKAV